MKPIKPYCILLLSILCCCNTGKRQSVPGKKTVEIIQSPNGFRLYRHGRPYVIKGACVLDTAYLQQAKESGANSIRTYSTDNAQEVLNAADKLGLTVTLGIKLPYADIEMDYADDKAVARQMEIVRKEVLKYKDHPALLMWGIGNELNLYLKTYSVPAYISLLKTIEKMAKMIHELDPDHPTTTTIPYVRKNTISAMDAYCSNLDVISINSFEELNDLPEQAKKYSKPYIVSEYGANGYWLSAQTDWNTHFEQTSQEKSAFIIAQSKVLQSDTAKCLGSYAFIWAHKLEYTTSWFSLFNESGEATQVVDALQYTWTGKWPQEKSPAIYAISVNNRKSTESIYLQPGKNFTVSILTDSCNSADMKLTFQLIRDELEVAELYSQAYYKQEKNPNLLADSLPQPVISHETVMEKGRAYHRINMLLQAPDRTGPYRLFVNLHNHNHRVATANACFYVHD